MWHNFDHWLLAIGKVYLSPLCSIWPFFGQQAWQSCMCIVVQCPQRRTTGLGQLLRRRPSMPVFSIQWFEQGAGCRNCTWEPDIGFGGTAIRVRRDASVELLGKAKLRSCHICIMSTFNTHRTNPGCSNGCRICHRRFEERLSLSLNGKERVSANKSPLTKMSEKWDVGLIDTSHRWTDGWQQLEIIAYDGQWTSKTLALLV